MDTIDRLLTLHPSELDQVKARLSKAVTEKIPDTSDISSVYNESLDIVATIESISTFEVKIRLAKGNTRLKNMVYNVCYAMLLETEQ